MRTCKKCGKRKPLTDFPPQGNGGELRRHECRKCLLERYHRYYRTQKSRYSAKAKANYESRKRRGYYDDPINRSRIRSLNKRAAVGLRQEVLEHYGKQCACCGEDIDRFLTIDHVNDDGREQREVHGTGLLFYRWLKRKGYPEGFQTLCFNCNLGRALNKGICPHKEGSTTIP